LPWPREDFLAALITQDGVAVGESLRQERGQKQSKTDRSNPVRAGSKQDNGRTMADKNNNKVE
jgi:hypothetical protein